MDELEFHSIRGDWFANGELVARKVKLAISGHQILFRNFPKHWIILFEYFGISWSGSTDPKIYLPFLSALSEKEVLGEINSARQHGQLRLLLELVASSEVILGETLHKIDCSVQANSRLEINEKVRLTNWHAYLRPEFLSLQSELNKFEQKRPNVIFLPCGKKRPYDKAPGYLKLRKKLAVQNIDLKEFDQIVITSLGFIPQEFWTHPLVMKYDTGVRDVYRMLVMARRLLKNCSYTSAIDCMNIQPYRDLIRILQNEKYVVNIVRPKGLRNRNLPAYKL